jgi:hypothetical protein
VTLRPSQEIIMAHPKQQHYVPQLLLRGFATVGKEQLYALDKQTGKVFQTSMRNVATEKGFYDIKTQTGIDTLEHGLSRLESVVAPIITRIRAERSLSSLTAGEPEMIALFAMVQHQRTTNYRQRVSQMNADLLAKIRRMGFDTDQIDGITEFNEDSLQDFAVLSIGMAIDFVPHILDKAWILQASNDDSPFFLADNPVALQNRKNFGPYGNLGFAVPGIEVFLPLSSTLCLSWYSASFIDEFTVGIANAEALKLLLPDKHERLDANIASLSQFIAAAGEGNAVQCTEDNVLNINALQLRNSERFVFSLNGDFAVAHKILAEKPHWRTGPRGRVD